MNSIFRFLFEGLCSKGCFVELYGGSECGNEQVLMSMVKEAAISRIVSLYIDSTGKFRPERVLQMMSSDDVSALKALDFLSALNSEGLMSRISGLLSTDRYDLLIWDSPAYTFYEASNRHELGLISRMLSSYAISGHKAIIFNPLVEITGLPAGHTYTDPYVHFRSFLKREGNRLFMEGPDFKREYIITSSGAFLI